MLARRLVILELNTSKYLHIDNGFCLAVNVIALTELGKEQSLIPERRVLHP